MRPRERAGQDSIARAAPAGHSAPIPMPSSARNRKRNPNVGEKPAMKLQIEYHRIEIISGVLRPIRSASHPEPTAPTSRSHKVTLSKNATSVNGTPNSCEIGTMISRNIVKSNASKVQPSQEATQAYHWSFVGSFHQGIGVVAVSTAVLIVNASSLTAGVQPAVLNPRPPALLRGLRHLLEVGRITQMHRSVGFERVFEAQLLANLAHRRHDL